MQLISCEVELQGLEAPDLPGASPYIGQTQIVKLRGHYHDVSVLR